MTVYELVEALGGEIVLNQARVNRNGQWIVLGAVVNGQMTLTEAGQRLVNTVAVQPMPAESVASTAETPTPVPSRRGRPRKVDGNA